jgi:BlaI family transcriptional regulator, penicillinase repressor
MSRVRVGRRDRRRANSDKVNLSEESSMTSRSQNESPRPTEAELDILRVLWERGDCTVREVHDSLYGDDGAGYTTALKLMQIMHVKGLVERDDSQRAHVYRAAVSKQRTQRRFMAEMVQRLFNGSPSQLVLHALGDHPRASRDELRQIRELLNRIDAEKVK